jgi:hypothetical protein
LVLFCARVNKPHQRFTVLHRLGQCRDNPRFADERDAIGGKRKAQTTANSEPIGNSYNAAMANEHRKNRLDATSDMHVRRAASINN